MTGKIDGDVADFNASFNAQMDTDMRVVHDLLSDRMSEAQQVCWCSFLCSCLYVFMSSLIVYLPRSCSMSGLGSARAYAPAECSDGGSDEMYSSAH